MEPMMYKISLRSRLERNPDFVWTDMDGETVMMSLARGEYLGLGGVGGRIWELLAVGLTAAEICESVIAEFDVEDDPCQADVLAFLGTLLEAGAVRPS